MKKLSGIGLIFLLFFLIACSSKKSIVEHVSKGQKESPMDESILIEATKYKLLGDYDKALELYSAFLLKFPGSATAAYNMGSIYFIQGYYMQAYDYALKATQFDKTNVTFGLFYIDCCFQTQHISNAFDMYDRLLLLQPLNADLWMEYANLLFQTKKYSESLQVIQKFERKNDLPEDMVLLKNRDFYLLNLPDSIEITLHKLIALQPQSLQYKGLLAEFYMSQNNFEAADSVYKSLINKGNVNGYLYLSMSNFERLRKNYHQALVYYFKAVDDTSIDVQKKTDFLTMLQQENPPQDSIYLLTLDYLIKVYPENTDILKRKARFFITNSESELALLYLKKVVELKPADIGSWMIVFETEYRLGLYELMYNDANKALEYYPNQAEIYFYAGIGALRSEKLIESISLLKTSAAYAYDNKELLLQIDSYLGEAYHFNKDYGLSDLYYTRALQLDSMNLVILNNYAYYLSERNDKLDLALSYITICVQHEPTNYIYLDTKAWILYHQNEYSKALIAIEKAVANGGNDDADILQHYGDILLKLGKNEKAKENWKKAYIISPTLNLKNKIENE
jgi:tetratricopeptide (TPR) repeat protein